MEKVVFDYQAMRMQQDAQEAIAAVQAWLPAAEMWGKGRTKATTSG